MLGRCHFQVCEKTPRRGLRVVKIDHVPHEVRAIAGNQFVGHVVRTFVVRRDEIVILLFRGRKLEAVEGSVKRRAYQFIPIAWGRRPFRTVGNNLFQVFSPVRIAHGRFDLRVGDQRNILGTLHGVQVRQQRHSQPIVTVDPVVPAQHHAGFPGLASPQHRGRGCTHVAEIYRRVTCSGQLAIECVWLLEEHRKIRARRNRVQDRRQSEQHRYANRCPKS